MEAKNVAKGSVKSCGQQIKCIRNWKSQYTSGQRSWQWRIVQSNALTPLLTSVQCPVHCPPFSPSRSLLRPPPGLPWDPVALSCKLILWPDCRIDNDNDTENENEDYLPNGVNSLLNNIALTCQQQKYLGAPSAHTASSSGNSLQFECDCIRIINYIPQSEMYN